VKVSLSGEYAFLANQVDSTTRKIMFDLFRSKKRSTMDILFSTLDEKSIRALDSVAKVLMLQLWLCRNQPSYNAELQSKFARGYLFGYFDAATQWYDMPHKSDEDAIHRIMYGHSIVFLDRNVDAIRYVVDSVGLQYDPTYKAAEQQGVNDLHACFGNNEKKPLPPRGLVQYVMGY
jgi:hypothetical protein